MPDIIPGSPPFSRISISPVAYISEAWGRVKEQYWLFLGITVVGMLLGGVAPLGIMLGPMMCGIYLCYRDLGRGVPVKFDLLFKGFDYFMESFIAALLMMAASLVVVLPLVLLMVGVMFMGVFTAAMGSSHGGGPQGAALAVTCLLYVCAFLLLMAGSMVVGLLFSFTFPLIIDRGMKGIDAVKLSIRAALANFWGLLGLGLTLMVLSLIGVCFCYVGAFLIMPITFGAHWLTYERVFGLAEAEEPAQPEATA